MPRLPGWVLGAARVPARVRRLDGIDGQLRDSLGDFRDGHPLDGAHAAVIVHPPYLQGEVPFRDGARDRRQVFRVDRVIGEFEW